MLSEDYDVDTQWINGGIISSDNVTSIPAAGNSSPGVFERYTWTQFLQVTTSSSSLH